MPMLGAAVVFLAFALLGGCASWASGPNSKHPGAESSTAAYQRQLRSAQRQGDRDARRIRALEVQLALARAELDELRSANGQEASLSSSNRRDTHGGQRRGTSAAAFKDVAPLWVHERLAVAPVPAIPKNGSSSAMTPANAPAAAPSNHAKSRPLNAATAYLEALALMRSGQVAASVAAFQAFIASFPNDERLPDAHYWRGVGYLALRDYRRALAHFQELLRRFPNADKAADALYKTAVCHDRMGERNAAKTAMQRLHRDYPSSQAARVVASRGDL